MESITLSPKREEIEVFIQKYRDKLVPSKNQYIQYLLKLNQATVSIYTSGKVLFQGEKAGHYAAFFGHQAEETSKTDQNISLIGTDEVGNGSYFGGLAVVASFVSPEQHTFLRNLGVSDSKKEIQHQALLLSPEKYNEVIASGYNAVSVKVALHNQAIYLLLQKGLTPEKIVIDAFTSQQNYDKYLQNEKNHFPNPVSLIEKAEGKFLAVAVSSIIARDLFLENLENLSQELGYALPSGAGSKSDQVASQILQAYGIAGLQHTAKLHFKNTEKAKKLLER